jgi:hypothetical protein
MKMDSSCTSVRCLGILCRGILFLIGNTIVCKSDAVYTQINLTDMNIKMLLDVVDSRCFVQKTRAD